MGCFHVLCTMLDLDIISRNYSRVHLHQHVEAAYKHTQLVTSQRLDLSLHHLLDSVTDEAQHKGCS